MSTSFSNFLAKFRAFRINHPIIWGLALIVLIFYIIVWLCMIFINFWTRHGDDSVVPEIKQLTYAAAECELKKHNLAIEISDSIYDTSIPAGSVVESWPKAGSVVKSGRKVYVTITSFSPKQVTLSRPLAGVSVRQAVTYLNALGINGIRFVNIPSEYVDLVENAHCDGRPIGVGSIIPVDAVVILEVGVPIEVKSDSISAEATIEAELVTHFSDDE